MLSDFEREHTFKSNLHIYNLIGHYATGVALAEAGVISGNDMTVEAISCKAAYLLGRGDLSNKEMSSLMGVSLRGEVTPSEALSPSPLLHHIF